MVTLRATRRDLPSEGVPAPISDRAVVVTRPVFDAIAQIANMDETSQPAPETLHQQMRAFIDAARQEASRQGWSTQEVDDIVYALVALADEQVLLRGGPLRDYWLPRMLQLQYFNENVAGENFFRRMTGLLNDPSRASTLKVYYLCLLFGFQGRYRVRGGGAEIDMVIEQVQGALRRSGLVLSEIVLSPHGARPYEAIADSRRNALLLWLAVAASSSAVVGYLWLRLDIAARASELVERIRTLSGG